MRKKISGYAVCLFLAGAAGAVASAATDRFITTHLAAAPTTWSTAFLVQVDGQDALRVEPDGKIEFGPAYQADTLKRLLDGLREIKSEVCFAGARRISEPGEF